MVKGFVSPGFEGVRSAFQNNFDSGKELGAACCIYYRGEKVVDIWGGIRDKASGAPWQKGTMGLVFSATKGLSAMAVAQSRGLFQYDDLVSTHWPEFSQHGKKQITIRQLLSHQAGLHKFKGQADRNLIADPDRLESVLAQQKPAWPPGTQQAYHAITLGYYEATLLRRTDAVHRSLGQFFQDEIATPLGLDVYIRLPEYIANTQLARLEFFNPAMAIFTLPAPLYMASLNPYSNIRQAIKGSLLPFDKQCIYARNFEVPAAGGVGTARAIAKAYSVLATGGRELNLAQETLLQLMEPAVAPRRGFRDATLKVDVRFSLGFMKPALKNPFAPPTAFGHPGAGGSFGLADPENKLGYAYVPNRMGGYLIDPRDQALRKAMYTSIGLSNPYLEIPKHKIGTAQ